MDDTAVPADSVAWQALRAIATALLLALALACSACGTPAQEQHPPISPPPAAAPSSSAPPTPSDQPPPVAASNPADLAQRPCSALDQRDGLTLGVVSSFESFDQDAGQKTCRWLTPAGFVFLVPGESIGTSAIVPNGTQLNVGGRTFTRIDVAGHQAFQARLEKTCGAYVSTGGPDRYFLITTTPVATGANDDPCATTTRFAAAILAHLGPP